MILRPTEKFPLAEGLIFLSTGGVCVGGESAHELAFSLVQALCFSCRTVACEAPERSLEIMLGFFMTHRFLFVFG